MSNPVFELVVYKVKNPQTAARIRAGLQPHVANYPGFLDWKAASSSDDKALFADIVTWESLDAARAAGQKVMTDPAYAPFMAEIGEIFSMGHFAEERKA
jgi:hypothetical protein